MLFLFVLLVVIREAEFGGGGMFVIVSGVLIAQLPHYDQT